MSKTASFPRVRVAPALREAAENVLFDDETLSSFAEEAIRIQVERRQHQAEFLKRCLTARDHSIETNSYKEPKEVHAKLRAMIEQAKNKI